MLCPFGVTVQKVCADETYLGQEIQEINFQHWLVEHIQAYFNNEKETPNTAALKIVVYFLTKPPAAIQTS